MNIILDIETIALPADQREATMPTYDTMKWGNTKDEGKRSAMLQKAVEEWQAGTKAALHPEQGQVALAGLDIDGAEMSLCGSEKFILESVWTHLSDNDLHGPSEDDYRSSCGSLVGHNLINFDLPFLVKRSWLTGVEVPYIIMSEIRKYRSKLIVDTMTEWGFGNKQAYVSLNHLCNLFGIQVKSGEITGENFGEYWARGKEDEAIKKMCIDYCMEDVRATKELAIRMGLINK